MRKPCDVREADGTRDMEIVKRGRVQGIIRSEGGEM